MMKKYLLSCLLALTLHIPALADGAKTQLVVWTKDGAHVAFALDERPQVTFTETELVITTKEAHHYALENMAKFTYEQIPDGIKSLLADDAAFILDGESLLFPALKAGSKVSLTSLKWHIHLQENRQERWRIRLPPCPPERWCVSRDSQWSNL